MFNFYGDVSTIIMCSSVIHIVCVTGILRNVLDDCCVQLLIIMDGERNHSMGMNDCLSLDNHYWSSDCGGVPSIGLPML